MQNEENFQRYTPQYPLPSDITSMSRQDTICQFCGVSYLIHNEIKALEEKCQKLEADLAFYAGMSSRETDLENKLQSALKKNSELELTININSHKFNDSTRKVKTLEEKLEQSEKAHRETKSTSSKTSSDLRLTYKQIQTIRNEYEILQNFHSKNMQNWKTYSQTVGNILQKEIQAITEKHRTQIEQYQKQLNETKQSYEQLQQSHIITQNDFQTAREELRLQQNELLHLHEQLSDYAQIRTDLENNFEKSKHYSQQLEKQLYDKDQLKKNEDSRSDQYQQQLNNEKELRLKTEAELEDVRSQLAQLTTEYEQLNTAKKDLDVTELNTRRKIDEMNRSRQAVLDRTREEYEKLLRKYTDLDEVYRELVDLREKDMSGSKTIRSELERLHNENVELIKQRETLHITHDIQIKKLHDSYTIKLREAEQWPDRLQSELNREREQHRIQINELERRLKESFITELNIEKQKFADLLRKYEHDSGYSTQQLRQELISTEKVTIEQRQYYTKQIEQLEKEKENCKHELDTLRDVLKDLHEQLNKQESLNHDRGDHLQLKEDLLAKEKSLFQAQSTIDQLQKELEQTREEMTTLQETVHKECTEREQLKDALIDARQQLLTLKKNGVLNGTASRSLHSPPVAFEHIEKHVSAPLPHSQNPPRNTIPSFIQSEPTRLNDSIPGEAADLAARPISQNVPYRAKPLPPIVRSQQQLQQQRQRRTGNSLNSHKTDPLLENQRRIARFMKYIK